MLDEFILARKTKTEKTQSDYMKMVQRLRQQASRWYIRQGLEYVLQSGNTVSDEQLVYWLVSYAPEVSKQTYTLYKSAIVFAIQNEELALFLINYGSELSYKSKDRTPQFAVKAKSINAKDWQKLMAHLDKANGQWDKIIKRWLQAGLLCGLRPVEWTQSELLDTPNGLILHVKNAKNTNGRSNGEYRDIVLSGMNDKDIAIIKENLENIQLASQNGEYENMLVCCQNRLRSLNRSLFGKRKRHITLYSARHQFSADAKRSGMKREEVSALMGHGVDKTAILHYGKKQYGRSGAIKVKPKQEQVATVKRTSDRAFMESRLAVLRATKQMEHQINKK